MAIAFDAQSYGNSNTVSHTTSGTNRILIVAVSINIRMQTCSGITYGGVAMTQVAGIGFQQSTPGNASSFYVFSLINPALGANNIVVSTSGGTGTDTAVVGTSYTGAKQSGQPDASGSTSQILASSITKSISVVDSNCWQWGGANWAWSLSDPTTTTKTGNFSTFRQAGGYKHILVADSNGIVGTGSQSAGFSFSSSVLDGFITLSIAPSIDTNNSAFFQFF